MKIEHNVKVLDNYIGLLENNMAIRIDSVEVTQGRSLYSLDNHQNRDHKVKQHSVLMVKILAAASQPASRHDFPNYDDVRR